MSNVLLIKNWSFYRTNEIEKQQQILKDNHAQRKQVKLLYPTNDVQTGVYRCTQVVGWPKIFRMRVIGPLVNRNIHATLTNLVVKMQTGCTYFS